MVKHRPRIPDPLAEYEDWIRHRYTGGYYTGGRLSPLMRAVQGTLSPWQQRIGLVFVCAVILAFAASVAWMLFE